MSLEIKNLTKNFKINRKESFTALSDISLKFEAGDIVGLQGKNGSGKTTLLKTIAKIYEPNSGLITGNSDVIGIFDITSGLNPRLKVKDSVYLWSAFLGISKKRTDELYQKIIDFSEIEKFKNAKSNQLSLGMALRLIFAIAMTLNPKILIIDEGLAPEDEYFKNKILTALKDLAAQGSIIFIASHSPELLKDNCTKVVTLQEGKISSINTHE